MVDVSIIPLVIVIIGSVIGGLVLARHSVIGFWPGANDALYGWMGLRVPQPGDGLEISLKSPQNFLKERYSQSQKHPLC